MAKTKGSHVVQAVKVLRHHRERALAALAPHLHKYLEQRILPSSWYPTEDHLALLRVVVTLLPPAADPWQMLGRGNAQLDLGGIYRNQLKAGQPGRTLQAVEAIWMSAYDSGRLTISLDGATAAAARLDGLDIKSRELCRILTGYFMEAATLAGAHRVKASHIRCCSEGAADCLWQIEWQL
jgi:hypothetical protein